MNEKKSEIEVNTNETYLNRLPDELLEKIAESFKLTNYYAIYNAYEMTLNNIKYKHIHDISDREKLIENINEYQLKINNLDKETQNKIESNIREILYDTGLSIVKMCVETQNKIKNKVKLDPKIFKIEESFKNIYFFKEESKKSEEMNAIVKENSKNLEK